MESIRFFLFFFCHHVFGADCVAAELSPPSTGGPDLRIAVDRATCLAIRNRLPATSKSELQTLIRFILYFESLDSAKIATQAAFVKLDCRCLIIARVIWNSFGTVLLRHSHGE